MVVCLGSRSKVASVRFLDPDPKRSAQRHHQERFGKVGVLAEPLFQNPLQATARPSDFVRYGTLPSNAPRPLRAGRQRSVRTSRAAWGRRLTTGSLTILVFLSGDLDRRSGLIFYCLARAAREAVKNRFPELSLRPPRSPVTTLRYLKHVCSPSG